MVTFFVSNVTRSYSTYNDNFTSTFLITTFCLCLGISEVCLWVEYDKIVLHRLVFILFTGWQYEEFWRYPPDYSHVTLSVQTMAEKSILNLLCQPNKEMGHCGHDHMVVGLTTTVTYVISAYHHYSCEFKSRSCWGVLDITLCDKVCQWLSTAWLFSLVSFTNKTDCHNITETLLKVMLNTIALALTQIKCVHSKRFKWRIYHCWI